jgi:hypothetical protein
VVTDDRGLQEICMLIYPAKRVLGFDAFMAEVCAAA